MFRVSAFLALGLSLALTGACNRAERADRDDDSPLEPAPTVLGDRNPVRPSPVTVEGCLTASGDRFVLTQLTHDAAAEPGASQPGTEAYRLVGMEDELRPHVGKRVRITGEAEPEQVVDVRQSSPPADANPAGTAGSPRTPQRPEAEVETTETARIEINDLQVRSVSATSEACVATR